MPHTVGAETMELQISTTQENGWLVLALGGEFDTYAASAVRDKLSELIGQADPPRIVVDLAKVTFMDSSALGVLVGALRTAHALKGEIRLAAAPENLQPLFRITGLNRTFDMFDTVTSATTQDLTETTA